MIDPDIANLQILVVEDEKFMRQLVHRVLGEFGCHNIIEAEDGAEGYQSLVSVRPRINLVLLDLQMPRINGFQFLQRVRKEEDPLVRDVPIVVLTGHAELENVAKAAQIGIHGFLVKPVSKAAMEKQLRRAISGPPIDPNALPKA